MPLMSNVRSQAMECHHFGERGFEVVPAALSADECLEVASLVEQSRASVESRSLLTLAWGSRIAHRLMDGPVARLLPPKHVAVQCTYFEKSADHNWLVPIHQDLSIPVAQRVEHVTLRGWSEKGGMLFVQPPLAVLEQLVAVRLHLDPCSLEDGPLKVVSGSHRQGRIDPTVAASMRRKGEVRCTASPGDALVMRPLLLHASSKSTGQTRRRVLHFVFGPRALPLGLRWQHAI